MFLPLRMIGSALPRKGATAPAGGLQKMVMMMVIHLTDLFWAKQINYVTFCKLFGGE